MSFPNEAIDAAKLATVDAVNGALAWIDRMAALTRTMDEQVVRLDAECKRLAAVLATAEADRDDARHVAANLADEKAELRRQLAAAADDIAVLRDRYEGRVPAGPVAVLLDEVVALATATGDPIVQARWSVMADAARTRIAESVPNGGVRRDDPLIATLRSLVIADGLLPESDVDAKLAAVGLGA